MSSPKRNDPCPCGSGLKYKKCCLLKGSGADVKDDSPEGIRAQAFKDMSERKWNEALEGFKSIIDSIADNTQVLEAIAACYDGMDDFLHAAEFYEKCLTICGPDREYEMHYRLGTARACANRIDNSIAAFRTAREKAPDERIAERLDMLLDQLDRIDRGEDNPFLFLIQVQLQRAFSEMDEDRFEEAAYRLENVLPKDPENPLILYNLELCILFSREKMKR